MMMIIIIIIIIITWIVNKTNGNTRTGYNIVRNMEQ